MFEVACPHCGAGLAFEQSSAGRKIKCVVCEKKFTVPKPPPAKTTTWFAFLFWCFVLLLIAGLGLSIWLGLHWGLFFLAVLVFGICTESPYARRMIKNWIVTVNDWCQSQLTAPREQPLHLVSIQTVNSPSIPSTSNETRSGELETQMKREELVEIQRAGSPSSFNSQATSAPLPIMSGVRSDVLPAPRSVLENHVTESGLSATVPVIPETLLRPAGSFSKIEFFGPDSVVTLDRGVLRGPLIYAVPGTIGRPYDPSLIEFGLHVGRPGILPGQEPGNSPSYRQLNSAQRSFYLDWLLAGRRRRDIPNAYLVMFVQGLERRVLIDAQDHQAIAVELLGLLASYRGVFANRHDLTALLWMTIQLSCDEQAVSDDIVDAAIQATEDWNDALYRYCLATFAQLNWSVTPNLARLIAAQSPLATTSVVQQRHAEKFNSLFEMRIRETFPDGLKLSLSGHAEKLEYLIQNPTLMRIPRSETRLQARRRVANDCPEIQALLTVWGRCTNDMKSYDRAHRAADSGKLTSEMWEALPEIAREDEHPEAAAWSNLVQQGQVELGRPLVRIKDLADVKKIESRGRLTKKQSEQLLTTAYHLRLAIEPDARILGRNYLWDEMVAVFPLRDNTPEDLATYHAASILLRLGVNIAAADGEIDEEEVLRITSHLTEQFELTTTSAERLEHLRYALVHSPVLVGTLEKSLQEKLNPEQRQLVGEFLVGVAAADGTISAEELKALKKAWQALGLLPKTLNSLLKITQTPSAVGVSASESIVLDQARIAEIMRDTQRVAEMLRSAMGEEEEGDSGLNPVQTEVSAEKRTSSRELGTTQNQWADANRSPLKATDSPVIVPEFVGAIPTASESPTPLAPPNASEVADLSTSTLWTELQPRYHAFLRELLTQTNWDRKSLDQIARSQGLMLGGALEAINEMAFSATGDWLIIEDGDEVQVQVSLLKSGI
ncbi:MAG: hypothetical protein JWM11_6535 [Planctomycetaceae bacterium]|nr:hypothetical protein [Planctomycetaceae bacterium]